MTTDSRSDPGSNGNPRFVAVTLMASSSDAAHYEPLYEECFTLVEADTLDQAREKALVLARERETQYKNEAGETIRWSFLQLIDVSPVLADRLEDGAEIYARHFRNYDGYRAFEVLAQGSQSRDELLE